MSAQVNPTERQPEQPFVAPPVDVFENQDGLLLRADLPGVTKADVSVHFHDNELVITGKRRKSPEGDALHRGIRHNDFRRAFTLHQNVDVDSIEAKIQHGVLTVFLPKAEAVRPRQIEIQSA